MRNRVSAIAAQTLPIDIAVSTMKRDLLCIVPPGVLAGPMGSDAVNTALTQPLMLEIFTTSATIGPDAPWGDLQKIDYWLQDPPIRSIGGGRDLIRGVTHNLLATTQVPPEPQSLLAGRAGPGNSRITTAPTGTTSEHHALEHPRRHQGLH